MIKRYSIIKERIQKACIQAGRDISEIRLIAVSKKQSPEKIRALYELGHRDFGENYLNELQAKAGQLSDLKDIRWIYIGMLQSHKISACFQNAQEVQSLCSLKHAQRLDQHAKAASIHYPVYIQVNAEKEPSKGGVPPEDFEQLKQSLLETCPNLYLEGVMAIPSPLPEGSSPQTVPDSFKQLKQLAERTPGRQLSLGMSFDLEPAILAGSTCLRIGEGIFGSRDPSQN